jgi:hypothetical protein
MLFHPNSLSDGSSRKFTLSQSSGEEMSTLIGRHDIVLIAIAGVITRLLNRSPPTFERLLQGIVYYDSPSTTTILASSIVINNKKKDLSLKEIEAHAEKVSKSNVHSIAYSSFPQVVFPWESLVSKDLLSMVSITLCYNVVLAMLSSVAYVLVKEEVNILFLFQTTLLISVCMIFIALFMHLQRLSISQFEVQISLVFFAIATVFSFLGLYFPMFHRLVPVPHSLNLYQIIYISLIIGVINCLLFLPNLRKSKSIYDVRKLSYGGQINDPNSTLSSLSKYLLRIDSSVPLLVIFLSTSVLGIDNKAPLVNNISMENVRFLGIIALSVFQLFFYRKNIVDHLNNTRVKIYDQIFSVFKEIKEYQENLSEKQLQLITVDLTKVTTRISLQAQLSIGVLCLQYISPPLVFILLNLLCISVSVFGLSSSEIIYEDEESASHAAVLSVEYMKSTLFQVISSWIPYLSVITSIVTTLTYEIGAIYFAYRESKSTDDEEDKKKDQ